MKTKEGFYFAIFIFGIVFLGLPGLNWVLDNLPNGICLSIIILTVLMVFAIILPPQSR